MSDKMLNNNFRFSILTCRGFKEIQEKLWGELEKYADIFPRSKEAKVLLKPNLNSYMNALTGNTTDLRILAAVIEFLKNKGYHNITIGEGTSSGFYREKINIFSRLYVDRLAKFYGVEIMDLNYAPSQDIDFEYGIKAKIARITQEADFFINLPKLKTHFETQLSVCLKNMMGTLVGLPNKQKTHRSLYRNILNLNKHVKPHLHIVDSLIAMEGTGPSSGTPLNLGFILIGTNPYLVDLACVRLAGFDYAEIPYLKIAKELNLINDAHIKFVDTAIPGAMIKRLRRPKENALVRFINNQKWQHYFIKIRLAPGVNRIFSTKFIGKILNLSGLRQDVFVKGETLNKKIYLDNRKCRHCGKCLEYCPLGLVLPEALGDAKSNCIGCLYCFLVCPENALKIEGNPGFLCEQIKRYDNITRSIA